MAKPAVPVPGSASREPWHIDVMIEELRAKRRSEETYLVRQVREGRLLQKACDFKLAALDETVKLLELIADSEAKLLVRASTAGGFVPVDTIETLILDWRRDLAARAEANRQAIEAAPAEAPITGVTGGQKSLFVHAAKAERVPA